jgi:hypothetical protein
VISVSERELSGSSEVVQRITLDRDRIGGEAVCRSIRIAVVVLSALVLSPMAVAEVAGQEFSYTGRNVEFVLVRTNYSAAVIAKNQPFRLLSSSTLQAHVNPGDSDLFVFELIAECTVDYAADNSDGVDVQARLNGSVSGPVGGGVALLQPQALPTGGRLCEGPGLHAASKSWVVTLTGGESGTNWTFTIWWRFPSVADPERGHIAVLQHRTVRLTRYD